MTFVERVARLVYFTWWIVAIVSAAGLIGNVLHFGHPFPRDDTDSVAERSGMVPLTDHGTGCQYLRSTTGALTPRLGRNGLPMCGGAS